MGVEGDTGMSQAQHMKGNLKQCHLVRPAGDTDTPCRINHITHTLVWFAGFK